MLAPNRPAISKKYGKLIRPTKIKNKFQDYNIFLNLQQEKLIRSGMTLDTTSFAAMLRDAADIVLIGHFNPDGDAVGSVTAAYHFLKDRGRRPRIILPSPYPDNLAFLAPESPGERIVVCEKEPEEARRLVAGADLIICLDMNCLARTEYLEADILAARGGKVLIDHHVEAETGCFDAVFSTTEVSSTCELLWKILLSLPETAGDPARIGLRCAESVYVGMMTDTNNFSNSVHAGTFRTASQLLDCGVDKDALQEKVLSSYSVSRLRLMGHMLKNKMTVLPERGAAYMILSNAEKDRYHFQAGDSEGFVNLPLAVAGVQLSALFTENFDGRYIRVSLRSKGNLNVNRFAARYFNGGGHRNASGGRLYLPLDAVPSYFEKALEEWPDEEKFS